MYDDSEYDSDASSLATPRKVDRELPAALPSKLLAKQLIPSLRGLNSLGASTSGCSTHRQLDSGQVTSRPRQGLSLAQPGRPDTLALGPPETAAHVSVDVLLPAFDDLPGNGPTTSLQDAAAAVGAGLGVNVQCVKLYHLREVHTDEGLPPGRVCLAARLCGSASDPGRGACCIC